MAIAGLLSTLGACGGGDQAPSGGQPPNAGRAQAQGVIVNAGNWVAVPANADPLFQNLTIPADASTKGMWSGVQAWPLNSVHLLLLPNGKVLGYGTPTGDAATQNARYYDLWDPAQGFVNGSHVTTYRADLADSFCSAAIFLGDGRLMIGGGNGFSRSATGVQSTLYVPASSTLSTDGAATASPRWYSTMLKLPDGRPLMLGGMVPYTETNLEGQPETAMAQGLASMTPEVYENGAWRSLLNAYSRLAFGPDYLRASYPRAWVAPSGLVFGVSAEQMWTLDPANNGTLTSLGGFKSAPDTTIKPNVGATNTAVMYDVGKILIAGGNGAFNGDGRPASNQVTVIDINGPTPTLTEQPAMTYARRFGNSIVLPDGKVAVTGGSTLGNKNGANAVYAAELWDPATGRWTIGANAAVYRGYHSSSILLPNGTVLSAGGGAPGPVNNLNAEIYYPPQLFTSVNGVARLAPRPVISAISGLSYANGDTLQLDMASSAPIRKLVLIGLSSTTHSFNASQRRIPLNFTQESFRLSTTLPANTLTPPGYYQLVAIDAAGVPSAGVTVAVGQGVAAVPVATQPYTPPDISTPINAPIVAMGGTANYTVPVVSGVSYSWNFGDGSASTVASADPAVTHVFTTPGLYTVTLTAQSASGTSRSVFVQGVSAPATAQKPSASSAMLLEARSNASSRLWVVNPDADTVAVIDTVTNARIAEVAVGSSPRSIARAPDGRIWVVNKGASSISIVDPATLAVAQTMALPRASQPHGLVFAPDGSAAYVALEATGQLLKLSTAGAQQATLAVGPNVRHVSITADGATLLLPRFITPLLPGEATATVNTSLAGAEVVVVKAANLALMQTVLLRHSDKTDTETQGSGIPNYLGAALISPDGKSAWVPSKQDNIKRGTLRNSLNLNFQNTVRAITSRIDLGSLTEDYPRRIDHDNASLGSAAVFHPSGVYLFVALETSREVAAVDAINGYELFRIDVGRAPQGLAVSADGKTLYVQNFMDRSVGVVDLSSLVTNGQLRAVATRSVSTVAVEKLTPQVLSGKQLFYDARDTRLARDRYMSCASCHNDAGQDGRVWDLSGFGEGLRNTIALKGRAGMGHGLLHWSGNFDEVQDFEKQIRDFAGGTGLMADADYLAGTRNQPLGDRKTGISADLDALAAYIGSLSTLDPSPSRAADGSLTAAAVAGKAVFATANCASCHGGVRFTISNDAAALRDVGTAKASSGQRLGTTLSGLDVPTLRGVWGSAPYLHDGSAPTLQAAVQAHKGITLPTTDLNNLVSYLNQIGPEESVTLGAWGFDELPATGTTAADLSGLNHPLTLSKVTRVTGKVGQAAQFNGSSSVGSAKVAVVNTAASFSVAAWVRLDALNGWRTIANQDGTKVSGFWLQYGQAVGNKFALTMDDSDATTSTSYRAVSTTTPVQGQWYHVVGVRDKAAGTMKIYVNGKLERSTTYAGGWAANGAFNVGRGKWGGVANDWFAGALDQVQAFNLAVTDADVAQMYTRGKGALKAAWSFDDAGAIAVDVGGQASPLTLSNATRVGGIAGQALQFNGANTVGATAAPVLNTAASFSVATWVRLDALDGWRTMVNQDGANISGFWLQYSQAMGNKFVLTLHDSDATTSTPYRALSTTTPVQGQWYHVVGVRDKLAGTMKLYVNGRLEGTTAYVGGWAANGVLNVGRGKWGGAANDWFAGALDEVQVFNQPLGDSDVAQLYARGGPAPSLAPLASAKLCATEGQTCAAPTGTQSTVWFGANSGWAFMSGASGNVSCSKATFGDPMAGVVKSCYYVSGDAGNFVP